MPLLAVRFGLRPCETGFEEELQRTMHSQQHPKMQTMHGKRDRKEVNTLDIAQKKLGQCLDQVPQTSRASNQCKAFVHHAR